MGCDIHFFIEKRVNGKWELAPAPDSWNVWQLDHSGYTTDYSRGRWFSDRNYHLFALLAGVRASEKDDTNEPRGLPLDVCASIKADSGEWGCDGHSHTFFTMSELDTLRAGTVHHSGAIAEAHYKAWRESEDAFPKEWCGYTSAPTITEAEYKSGNSPVSPGPFGFYVYCEWDVSRAESHKRFFAMLDEVRKTHGDDCRAVFWFDN